MDNHVSPNRYQALGDVGGNNNNDDTNRSYSDKFEKSVALHDVITLEISDHGFTFFTRKSFTNNLKNYYKTFLEERSAEMKFPNYLLFPCANSTHSHLFAILHDTINELT